MKDITTRITVTQTGTQYTANVYEGQRFVTSLTINGQALTHREVAESVQTPGHRIVDEGVREIHEDLYTGATTFALNN